MHLSNVELIQYTKNGNPKSVIFLLRRNGLRVPNLSFSLVRCLFTLYMSVSNFKDHLRSLWNVFVHYLNDCPQTNLFVCLSTFKIVAFFYYWIIYSSSGCLSKSAFYFSLPLSFSLLCCYYIVWTQQYITLSLSLSLEFKHLVNSLERMTYGLNPQKDISFVCTLIYIYIWCFPQSKSAQILISRAR